MIELSRLGLITSVGDFKGSALYDGEALERFDDREALEKAKRNGRLLNRAEAVAHLGIRHSDLQHLITAKWLEPALWVRSGYQRRRAVPRVPLFRLGDLELLAEHPAIDWDDVRTTPKGRPSPLARLTVHVA